MGRYRYWAGLDTCIALLNHPATNCPSQPPSYQLPFSTAPDTYIALLNRPRYVYCPSQPPQILILPFSTAQLQILSLSSSLDTKYQYCPFQPPRYRYCFYRPPQLPILPPVTRQLLQILGLGWVRPGTYMSFSTALAAQLVLFNRPRYQLPLPTALRWVGLG